MINSLKALKQQPIINHDWCHMVSALKHRAIINHDWCHLVSALKQTNHNHMINRRCTTTLYNVCNLCRRFLIILKDNSCSYRFYKIQFCKILFQEIKSLNRAPDHFQVQRVITPYFWKWCVFAYFLYTVVLSTSEKIAYMYTFKIMFDTSVIQ